MDLASKCSRYEMMKKPNKQIKLEFKFKSTTKLEWNQVKSEFKNNKIWEKLGRNGIIKMFEQKKEIRSFRNGAKISNLGPMLRLACS